MSKLNVLTQTRQVLRRLPLSIVVLTVLFLFGCGEPGSGPQVPWESSDDYLGPVVGPTSERPEPGGVPDPDEIGTPAFEIPKGEPTHP